ncbi:MAG: threonine synthase, partial [Akkermansiaceae bacterium]
MPQKFYSTKSPGQFVDLKEAVLRSLPSDNGLYMPEYIDPLPAHFWENWRDLSLPEIGFEVAKMIFRDSVPEKQLEKIVHQSANFPAPLVTLKEREHILELFHGPTLAFKDFGARFMARLMGW